MENFDAPSFVPMPARVARQFAATLASPPAPAPEAAKLNLRLAAACKIDARHYWFQECASLAEAHVQALEGAVAAAEAEGRRPAVVISSLSHAALRERARHLAESRRCTVREIEGVVLPAGGLPALTCFVSLPCADPVAGAAPPPARRRGLHVHCESAGLFAAGPDFLAPAAAADSFVFEAARLGGPPGFALLAVRRAAGALRPLITGRPPNPAAAAAYLAFKLHAADRPARNAALNAEAKILRRALRTGVLATLGAPSLPGVVCVDGGASARAEKKGARCAAPGCAGRSGHRAARARGLSADQAKGLLIFSAAEGASGAAAAAALLAALKPAHRQPAHRQPAHRQPPSSP